jgi:hypothetical protein
MVYGVYYNDQELEISIIPYTLDKRTSAVSWNLADLYMWGCMEQEYRREFKHYSTFAKNTES